MTGGCRISWPPCRPGSAPTRPIQSTSRRCAGKRVAVLGAGASAFDNAAMALEAGPPRSICSAAEPKPQVVQPYRWLTFAGFLRHVSELDDAWRWRFMSRILGLREGFPQATYDRCASHKTFRLHGPAHPGPRVRVVGNAVELQTPIGLHTAEFLISAHRYRNGFHPAAGVAAACRQHRPLGRSIHAPARGTRRPARPGFPIWQPIMRCCRGNPV